MQLCQVKCETFFIFLKKIFPLAFFIKLLYNVYMKVEKREPKQERSIEKKNKIILASYELFSEVGYYGTNTAEIAKKAGVSTGIVYGYFKDKRDILISVLDIYIKKAFAPIFNMIDKLSAPVDIEVFVTKFIDLIIKSHKNDAKMHEALHSLTSTDEAVNNEFIRIEDDLTVKLTEKLFLLGWNLLNATEKVHLALDIVQSFAHESVFDKHDYIDYSVMKNLVKEILVDLFKN